MVCVLVYFNNYLESPLHFILSLVIWSCAVLTHIAPLWRSAVFSLPPVAGTHYVSGMLPRNENSRECLRLRCLVFITLSHKDCVTVKEETNKLRKKTLLSDSH